jgi:hypothetical protein
MKVTHSIAVEILVFFGVVATGCGERGGRTHMDDETLATAYAELAVTAEGDSARAHRVLDSLGLSREQFISSVSEKAEDLKKWQAIHETAMRKMDVAALREDRRRGVSTSPRQ